MGIKRGLKWVLIGVVVVGAAHFRAAVVSGPQRPSAPSLAHLRACRVARERPRRGRLARYLAQEGAIFESVRAEVSQKLDPDERVPINRYFEESPVYPARFAQNWNRSYVMEPDGKPIGAVVLLHGLTDSPYSLRHIAKLYRDRGFVAIGVRLPGHGTVPAGLTDVRWEDWMAATRLAVREARRRVPAPGPLHLVGFSNGGALAMKYCARSDRGSEASPGRPHRIDHADDRDHALCALCRSGRPARRAAAVREGGLAQRRAGVQSVQVQLVPGQRRPPVVSADRCAAKPDPAPRACRPARKPAAGSDLPVGGRFHRQHAGDPDGAVCVPARQRQRDRSFRREPDREIRPAAAPLRLCRARSADADVPAAVSLHVDHQRERRQRRHGRAQHRAGPAASRGPRTEPALSTGHLLAVAPGDPDSHGRPAVRARSPTRRRSPSSASVSAP